MMWPVQLNRPRQPKILSLLSFSSNWIPYWPVLLKFSMVQEIRFTKKATKENFVEIKYQNLKKQNLKHRKRGK